MYASYDDYTGPYGGTVLSAEDWPRLELRAAAFIDYITYGRLKLYETVPQEVRLAVCAVAEVIQSEETAIVAVRQRTGIKSFSNDGYSETFTDPSEIRKQFEAEKLAAAGRFLPLSHPLRYAGV